MYTQNIIKKENYMQAPSMSGCIQADLANTTVKVFAGCRIKQYINRRGSLPQRSHRHVKTPKVDGKASFRTSKHQN
jgi:hypothetical protein